MIIKFVIGKCWEVWASYMDIKIYLRETDFDAVN